MNQSLDYRRDNRTLSQFINDITNRTRKERFLVELFQQDCQKRGQICSFEDFGVDNSGTLQHKSNCKPDYRITLDGIEGLYDVKNSPVKSKWTFKVHPLKQYIKFGAHILLFWGTGYIDRDLTRISLDGTRYGILSLHNITKMLETYDHYKEEKFGNKVCIRVPSRDFPEWVNEIRSLV